MINSDARSVLLIAFHFPPESVPGSARPGRFFKYLPEFGYAPHVITAAEQSAPAANVSWVPATTVYPNKYTLSGAIEIALHKFLLPGETGLLWAAPAIRAGGKILRAKRVAAVFSTAPPTNAHLVGLAMKRRYGLPWIADFRDPVVGSPFRSSQAIHRAVDRTLERLIFKHANAVIGVTDVMVEEWRARYPQWTEKMHLLWNGFDPAEEMSPAPLPPRSCRVLAHVGSVYGIRNPMRILCALERLIRSGRMAPGALRIQLVGGLDGEAAKEHQVLAQSNPTLSFLQERHNLDVYPFMPRKDALEFMVGADYLMLLDMVGDAKGYAVPSKLYEYIRIGRPMLTATPRDSPVERILARSGTTYVAVYPDDTDTAIEEKLLQLAALSPEATTPNQWFLDNFDGQRQTMALAHLLDKILEKDVQLPQLAY